MPVALVRPLGNGREMELKFRRERGSQDLVLYGAVMERRGPVPLEPLRHAPLHFLEVAWCAADDPQTEKERTKPS